MQKLFYISISLIIVSLVMGAATLFSQEEIATADEGKRVLEEYFYNMKTGNTSEILDMITGPLLKKRERLLRYNTQYGTFLKQKYEDAQFSIIGHRIIDAKRLALDAQIILNDQDILKTRFVLVQNNGLLKIYSEEEIPQHYVK